MRWTGLAFLAVFVLPNGALAQGESSVTDCFDIQARYDNNDERAGALLNCVEALATKVIPAGAVMAFDLPNGCPSGWRARFTKGEGRFLIGVGATTDERGETRNFTFDSPPAGTYRHQLILDQIPPHFHSLDMFYGAEFDNTGGRHPQGADYSAEFVQNGAGSTNATGGENGEAVPHNNLPPYVAVYYCKKE